MAEETKVDVNPAATPPAAATPAASGLPPELAGKSVEDVARYYTDRYKDYDDVRARASAWDEVKYKPEEAKTSLDLYDRITNALRTGNRLYLDANGQIMSEPVAAAAQRKEAAVTPSDPADWLNDWELKDPRDQARRLEARAIERFNEVIAAKEKQYGDTINGQASQLMSMLDAALNLVAECQEHPELKIREVLKRGAELRTKNPGIDGIRAAIDSFLAPGEIERQAKERAAAIIAEQRAKEEKERAERQLSPGNGGGRSMLEAALRGNGERISADSVISNLRQKGLLQ